MLVDKLKGQEFKDFWSKFKPADVAKYLLTKFGLILDEPDDDLAQIFLESIDDDWDNFIMRNFDFNDDGLVIPEEVYETFYKHMRTRYPYLSNFRRKSIRYELRLYLVSSCLDKRYRDIVCSN